MRIDVENARRAGPRFKYFSRKNAEAMSGNRPDSKMPRTGRGIFLRQIRLRPGNAKRCPGIPATRLKIP
jgi:hypothetical protein